MHEMMHFAMTVEVVVVVAKSSFEGLTFYPVMKAWCRLPVGEVSVIVVKSESAVGVLLQVVVSQVLVVVVELLLLRR